MTVRNLNHQNYERNQHQLAQREFNREKAEFKKAKEELTDIRSERREGIEQRQQLQNARENAQNQLAQAQQTGDAAQINLAQQRLAEKNHNLAALNLRLHNLNGRLTETAAEVKAERKEMAVARRELNETLTPEIKREQTIRRDVNNALGGLKVQVENGEPIGIFRDQVKESLFNNIEVPINANLSDEAALKIARQRADSPYFAAEKEARIELVRSGAESVTKSYTYEHRIKEDRGYDRRTEEGKVEVSVRFTEKSRISESGRNNEPVSNVRKVTREDVERIKDSEIKKMKMELAETGAESLRRNVALADGRTLQLEVNADWQAEESVKVSRSSGDRDTYEWKSYNDVRANRSSRNDDGGVDLPLSARLQGAESVKKIAAEKAKTAERLQEQLMIQGYIAQSRLEAVQSGETDGFKDRKIIGKNVYEVYVEAKFEIDTKRLNPNELNSVERQIQNNPTLSREQIAQMRENFAKGLEQAKEAMIQTLKEGLALSGDSSAEGTFTYRGEQHKVTVKAEWKVDAELHRTPDKADVERHVREMLLQNGGKEIAGKFFNHNAKGSADFDLDSRQLRSPKPSEMEMLDLRKANLSPAEYELLKKDIDTRTKFDLSAAAQDMLNDLARTGDEELKRVVTTSTGERLELTVRADWDVDVKKIDQLKLGIIQGLKMVGMMAAIVGTAGVGTPLAGTMAAIGAGANVVSSGLQGDWLGAGIGALGMAGGIVGGSLGQTLQFGARAANTARGLADGNFTFTDALSIAGTAGAGLQLLGASTNSVDAVKIGDKLLDLEKYGGYVDSALRGDGEGVFMAVATELIGAAARFRNTQEAENPRTLRNGSNRGDGQFGSTDELLNALGNPERLAEGLRDGSIRAGITNSLRDGVFNDDLNRVRQTYNGIYRSMDERGRAALDLIDSNARRRGIDPMVARAQVNNLLTEMSDLPQLIRNNAARRGLPVEYSERIISDLLRESGRDVDLATIVGAAKTENFNPKKLKGFQKDVSEILGNLSGKNINASSKKLSEQLVGVSFRNGVQTATRQEINDIARQLIQTPTVTNFNNLLERYDLDSRAAVILELSQQNNGVLLDLVNHGANIIRGDNSTPSDRRDAGRFSRALGRAYDLSPYQPGGGNQVLENLLYFATTSERPNPSLPPGSIYTTASDMGLIIGNSGNNRLQADFAESAINRSGTLNNDGRPINRVISNDLIVGAFAAISDSPDTVFETINTLRPENRQRVLDVLVNSANFQNPNGALVLRDVYNNARFNEDLAPFFLDTAQRFSPQTDSSVLEAANNYFNSEPVTIANLIGPDNSQETVRANQLANFIDHAILSDPSRTERAFADGGSIEQMFEAIQEQVFVNPNDQNGPGAARTAGSRTALLVNSIGTALANHIERGAAVAGVRERIVDLVVDKVVERIPIAGDVAGDFGLTDFIKDAINNGIDTEEERREFINGFNSRVYSRYESIIDASDTPEWQRDRLDLFLNRMDRILNNLNRASSSE